MSEWIPMSERLPIHTDADARRCVLFLTADGVTHVTSYDTRGIYWRNNPVAWMPIPRYTPPAPEPTNGECDRLCGDVRTAPGYGAARELIRDWFASVTARIQREASVSARIAGERE